MEVIWNISWPVIVAALIGTPLTLGLRRFIQSVYAARVKRAELREYKRLSELWK